MNRLQSSAFVLCFAFSSLSAVAADTCCSPCASSTVVTWVPSPRVALFDGKSLDGWVNDKGGEVAKGWQAVDGTLALDARQGRGGNILSAQEYDDFVLEFEWMISAGGNSGIKYKVTKFGNRTLGCEYQIIDDEKHRDGTVDKKSTGSLYDVYAPAKSKVLRPVGEFNQSKIVVRGKQIEHWLNGQLLLTASVGSADWYAKKDASKFNDVVGFGENGPGRIMLTDHNSRVSYRNLFLTPLTAVPSAASYVSAPTRQSRKTVRSRVAARRSRRK
jgi:hypothetical protein